MDATQAVRFWNKTIENKSPTSAGKSSPKTRNHTSIINQLHAKNAQNQVPIITSYQDPSQLPPSTFAFLASGASTCGLGPLFIPVFGAEGAFKTGAAPGGGVKGSTAGRVGVAVPLARATIPLSLSDNSLNCPIFAVGACDEKGIGDFEVEADFIDGAVIGGDGLAIVGGEIFGAVTGALGRGANPGGAPGVLMRGAEGGPECGPANELLIGPVVGAMAGAKAPVADGLPAAGLPTSIPIKLASAGRGGCVWPRGGGPV